MHVSKHFFGYYVVVAVYKQRGWYSCVISCDTKLFLFRTSICLFIFNSRCKQAKTRQKKIFRKLDWNYWVLNLQIEIVLFAVTPTTLYASVCQQTLVWTLCPCCIYKQRGWYSCVISCDTKLYLFPALILLFTLNSRC